jgi:hypothetical protein
MKVIKRYVAQADGKFHCAIWTNTYLHTLEHVLFLTQHVDEVDVSLNYHQINIVKYGGDKYKGVLAVEFVTKFRPPANWELDCLEPIS